MDFVRQEIQKFLSFPIWTNLSEHRRQEEFKRVPKFKKIWRVLQKHDAKMSSQELNVVQFERTFLAKYVRQFIQLLDSIPSHQDKPDLDEIDRSIINYCERFIEFLIDLESQLPLRRFFQCSLRPFKSSGQVSGITIGTETK